jgi:hypothetical protein
MGAEPDSTYGTRSSAKTAPGTQVLDLAQNTIKRCIIEKMHNEWQMAGMNE